MSEPEPDVGLQRQDIRPLVGGAVSNRAVWLFGAALLVGVGVLFSALESRRAAITAPAISAGPDDPGSTIGPAPDLAIPPAYEPPNSPAPATFGSPAPVTDLRSRGFSAARMPPPAVTPHVPQYEEGQPGSLSRASPTPEVVFESRRMPPLAGADSADGGRQEGRVQATRFANPSTTVPKGTVIQAVLETALDSTRAGFARAIISRDVYGFDGGKILIPKGSRLIGEYKADLALGQSRALIQWQRLMRPDGVLINLDSPSADPLGRAGVKGKVNSHFFERFGGAILQSALDIGVQVATNKVAAGTTIYALPGSFPLSGAAVGNSIASPEKVQPTLTVRQGTSVSVFVVKDLDFSTVEQ